MIYFEKVSREQFRADCEKCGLPYSDETYDNIKLPTRSTAFSAGYDFKSPFDVYLTPDEILTIPTGIRWVVDGTDRNVVLCIWPRSGQGFKTGARLMNTTGVIDADYWEATNEGHIMVKMLGGVSPLKVDVGQGFCQGVMLPFITTSAEGLVTTVRTGGFGSTDAL